MQFGAPRGLTSQLDGSNERGSGEVNMSRLEALPKAMLNLARELRRSQTDAEELLWGLLRNRRLGGYKFRRQQVLGHFILDFYCPQVRLAIELDGGGHAEPSQSRYDSA